MVEDKIFNRNTGLDYAIGGTLGVVSFPLAGFYLTRKKNMPSKFLGIGVGIILTTGLAVGTDRLPRGGENKIIDTANIQVIQYLSKIDLSAEDKISPSEIMLGLGALLGTNYFTYLHLSDSAKNASTKVFIKGKDGSEEFSCKYNFKNHLDVGDLTFSSPKEVTINNRSIHGEQGKNFYGGLCKQIFQKEVQGIVLN